MPINIQNLIDALNAKVAAVDSSTPLSKITLLNQAASYVNETNNILRYNDPISSVLNVNVSGDSANSNFGDFAFSNVDQKYYFSFGKTLGEVLLDDDAAVSQVPYVGENAGFVYGAGSLSQVTDIDYYPFASTTTASIIGDQTKAKAYNAGFADTSRGYSYLAGGYGRWPSPSNPFRSDEIDTHANASSNFTMANVGTFTTPTTRNAGVVDAEAGEGYLHLGGAGSPPTYQTRIDKFAFSSGTPVTVSPNVANTNATGGLATGITDYTNNKGYFRGVFAAETDLEFLPFSSGTPVTTTTITSPNPYGPPTAPSSNENGGVGMSSQTDAYCAIHAVYSGSYSTVEKFPLSSVTPATISTIPGIFDYQTGRSPSAGAVSATGGYMQGGAITRPNPSGTTPQTYLTKFPFAADNFTTEFGNFPTVPGFRTGSHW